MYRNILQSIEDIQVWPIIGLVIFFVFFVVVVIRVLKTDKTFTERMKNLPFDESHEEAGKNK